MDAAGVYFDRPVAVATANFSEILDYAMSCPEVKE